MRAAGFGVVVGLSSPLSITPGSLALLDDLAVVGLEEVVDALRNYRTHVSPINHLLDTASDPSCCEVPRQVLGRGLTDLPCLTRKSVQAGLLLASRALTSWRHSCRPCAESAQLGDSEFV